MGLHIVGSSRPPSKFMVSLLLFDLDGLCCSSLPVSRDTSYLGIIPVNDMGRLMGVDSNAVLGIAPPNRLFMYPQSDFQCDKEDTASWYWS